MTGDMKGAGGALANVLRAWRLRRIRWAMRTLNQRLATYEAAYGQPAVRLNAADLKQAGLLRIAEA